VSKALDLARAAMAARRAAGETIERLDPIEKARRNPTSLRLAINAKCWECVGGDGDPNPRQRIRDCTCSRCPLLAVRPYQARETENDDETEASS
jgi:hypothetical protein